MSYYHMKKSINVYNIFMKGIFDYDEIMFAFKEKNEKILSKICYYYDDQNPFYIFLHKGKIEQINLTILCPKTSYINTFIYNCLNEVSIWDDGILSYTEYQIENIQLGTRYIRKNWKEAIQFLEKVDQQLLEKNYFSEIIFTFSDNFIFTILYYYNYLNYDCYPENLGYSTNRYPIYSKYDWSKYILGESLKNSYYQKNISNNEYI